MIAAFQTIALAMIVGGTGGLDSGIRIGIRKPDQRSSQFFLNQAFDNACHAYIRTQEPGLSRHELLVREWQLSVAQQNLRALITGLGSDIAVPPKPALDQFEMMRRLGRSEEHIAKFQKLQRERQESNAPQFNEKERFALIKKIMEQEKRIQKGRAK